MLAHEIEGHFVNCNLLDVLALIVDLEGALLSTRQILYLPAFLARRCALDLLLQLSETLDARTHVFVKSVVSDEPFCRLVSITLGSCPWIDRNGAGFLCAEGILLVDLRFERPEFFYARLQHFLLGEAPFVLLPNFNLTAPPLGLELFLALFVHHFCQVFEVGERHGLAAADRYDHLRIGLPFQ